VLLLHIAARIDDFTRVNYLSDPWTCDLVSCPDIRGRHMLLVDVLSALTNIAGQVDF
jgi:hypothetical protein